MASGITQLAEGIAEDLQRRLPDQRKTQRGKLALLVATILEVRSANLMALAAALPREADRADMRYQWIARFIDNDLVDCDEVMEPFAREVLARAAASGRIVLIMDQTKASDRHQILMLSLRFGERALPLAWRVEATEGAIGFARQKELLDVVLAWLPPGAEVCLMADRFYGTPGLIALVRANGWDYRLRLKANLQVFIGGQKSSLAQHAAGKRPYLTGVELTHRRITTNIGIIHDPGHDEPWIIAMSAKPNYLTTLDYTARWGIEPMFSDFKSRGFGLEQSQLRTPERLGRLLLVMSLALYFAVSTGQHDVTSNPTVDEKKPTASTKKPETGEAVLLHPRHPLHRQADTVLHAHPTTLGI